MWDPAICIQCNKCALVCPHAAVRAKVYDPPHLAHAPTTFKATDLQDPAQAVERRVLEILRAVKAQVRIPVAVKLSPFYSVLAHLARELEAADAGRLVLFNRFYQPDINVEELAVEHRLQLSDSTELLLRLRWLAILSGRVRLSLAVTARRLFTDKYHAKLQAVEARGGALSMKKPMACLLVEKRTSPVVTLLYGTAQGCSHPW